MAEVAVELRAILDSAERAASAQDFVSAEHYLRQAAVIQEAQFGPVHPDLANTLNNLGIVFERVGKPADAEASYRRAYAIARTTLAADDPLALTSEQNLRDFCAATGRLFEPAPPSLDVVPPAPRAAQVLTTPLAAAAPTPPSIPAAPPAPPVSRSLTADTGAAATIVGSSVRSESAAGTSRRRPLTWLALASAIVILAMFAWLTAPSSTDVAPATPPAEAPASSAEGAAPPQETTESVREEAVGPREETSPAVAEAAVNDGPLPAVSPRPSSQGAVSLVEAKLCRSLSTPDWQCTLLPDPAEPGGVFYYTRVKADRDTTVQHRWFVNGNLVQRVELRVGANASSGFRTYSRNTVAAEGRGTWTIELRDADGALLREERFEIQ